METFKWCIRPNYSIDNEPDISEIAFGDGYTQRRLNGINVLLNTYSVSIKVKNKSAVEIQRFLKITKALRRFILLSLSQNNVKK
ncbi:Gifsy-1 prophage VmtM [Rodentibacter pneumotropicus]|uniref:Gifsy-1 prophage VmtM n=1 Tax=Rodentibacter pneumotropicus TaxID=758 RepID=A0A448MNI3_9PAST|nr:Gifsy-1 prophage VmtM [Rodentibacter pneumotropicus]